MDLHYYTDEKNAQIIIALLKVHGIRDIVISPGATNDCFVLSVQNDPDFQLYSAVDERHAAYMACGIAEEHGSPVVINCTGATASRNYMSGLTEAYYRKLPILVITCSQHRSHLGNLYPQMTDRITLPNDIVQLSVQCPIPHTKEEERWCELEATKAILSLQWHGGGPAHINLETAFTSSYSTKTLPIVRKIERFKLSDSVWPSLSEKKKIAVWIGSHHPFSEIECKSIESFASCFDAVLIGDVTSNCHAPSFINISSLCYQKGSRINPRNKKLMPDLIIHIGEISGDYSTTGWLHCGAEVWRVNEDGELRDLFGTLCNVFEMSEKMFFSYYVSQGKMQKIDYRDSWKEAIDSFKSYECPSLPFSELYIAKHFSEKIPCEAELHLGILNPLRCINMFPPRCKRVFCNVGGFGIDGNVSSLIGASLSNPDKLYFGIVGDLSFFYDMNSIGNRHVSKNIRLLVVNNGEGGEFSVPGNIFDNTNCGSRVHDFIAAKGHNGSKSRELVKSYAEALGFKYLCASTGDELTDALNVFCGSHINNSMLLECFTDVADDRKALELYSMIDAYEQEQTATDCIKSILPSRVKNIIKATLGQ